MSGVMANTKSWSLLEGSRAPRQLREALEAISYYQRGFRLRDLRRAEIAELYQVRELGNIWL